MKQNPTEPLAPLLHTLEEGVAFYRAAERETNDETLRTVFAKTAAIREFALAYLRPYLGTHHYASPNHNPVRCGLHNRYAALLEQVLSDRTLRAVRQIEENLIDVMITASLNNRCALVDAVLAELAPRVAANIAPHLSDEQELELSECHEAGPIAA